MLLGYLAVGALGLGLYLAVPNWRELGVFLLNLFFLQFFVVAATIPHELGHAFTARLFGLEVRQVVIGFGVPIFHCQLFGFSFEFRRVPLGGLALVLPDTKPRLRTRWFLMILAGPAVNLVLASVVYFAVRSNYHVNFAFTNGLNPISLFVLANLIVVIENLFPRRATSSHGACDSDGYQLLNILFGQGKQRQETEAERGSVIWHRFLKVVGVLFLSLCALLCFALCVVLAFTDMRQNSLAGFILLSSLFVGMGSFLCWAVYRLVKKPLDTFKMNNGTVAGADDVLSPYFPLMKSHTEDIQRIAEWPDSTSAPLFCIEINGMLVNERFVEAEERLREFLDINPRNLGMQIAYLVTLRSLKRMDEAAALCEQLVAWDDLSFASKAILKSERVRFLALIGKFEQAAIECEEYLAETNSVIAKANMLDGLASLPHNEDRPDYLNEADKWSRRALEIAPNFITLKGTRSAVLADLGRFAEAKPLLKEVFEQSESNTDKGIASFYLALCAKAEGDLLTAKKLAKQAARIYPQPWLLKRVQSEGLG